MPSPDNDVRSTFSIEVVEGIGTFVPELLVEETAAGVTVTVNATSAEELTVANFNLAYDSSIFTPESVEISTLLGSDSQVFSLAITDIEGAVSVGIGQIPHGGAFPFTGGGSLATVHFKPTPFVGSRTSSTAPDGPTNGVSDLMITGQTNDTVTLRWTEVNRGDYNNNSEVEIADLTPIVMLYGQDNSTPWGQLVDGDGNGEINLADITPIVMNFGSSLIGYVVYGDGAEVGTGITCGRGDYFVDEKTPVVYSIVVPHDPMSSEEFTVRPVDNPAGIVPGRVSNLAETISESGPPQTPTNLVTESSSDIGNGKILLGWTKSAFTNQYDVAAYEIQRSDAGLGTWEDLAEVSGDFDNSLDPGLADQSFDYRIRARDFTDLTSDWTAVATGSPWFQPLPDPPINVTAIPHATQGLAVELNWDPPVDGSAIRFNIYSQEQGGGGFTQIGATPNTSITQLSHTGLAPGTTYEYYVISIGPGNVESEPSNIATSLSSEDGGIVITSLTTDKTTHHEDGGEAASNLVVAADKAPDSVNWSATLGTVNGSGVNATWSCPPGSNPQVVTITCTVIKGTGSDIATLDLYVTEETIKTTYSFTEGGSLCGGTGYFIDFTRPMVEQPTEPFKSLSDFIDGNHVVTYNMWEIWCPPCLGEMPDMHRWAVDYEAYGYYHVGHSSTYSLQIVTDWLQSGSPNPPNDTRPWDKFHMFNESINGTGIQWAGDPVWPQFFSNYGNPSKSLPRSILFDRDGYSRLVSSTLGGANMVHWEEIIKQLTGAP